MLRRQLLAGTAALATTGCVSALQEHREELTYGEWFERPDGIAITVDPPGSTRSIRFGQQTFTPEDDHFYLVVPVSVENRTEDTITPPAQDDFEAGEEREPPYSRGTMAVSDGYTTTTIEPEESRREKLVFEVESGRNASTVPVTYDHTMWRWSATWSA